MTQQRKQYIYILLEEKGIDMEQCLLEKEGHFGLTINMVIEFVYSCEKDIIQEVENTFRKIDFQNGNIMDYIIFLAKGVIKATGLDNFV